MSKTPISPNTINPVDYYNKCGIEDVISLLLKKPCIDMAGNKALTYIKKHSDREKRMLVINKKTGMFEAELENGFGIKVGDELTAFQMLQKFEFKGQFRDALSYVIIHKMNNKVDYICVGGDYFKLIKKHDRYGIERSNLKSWKRQKLLDDHSRDILSIMESYDDFTIRPDNKNYQRVVYNCYNTYNPFDHKPLPLDEYTGEDSWKWTKILLEHIFGSDEVNFEKGTRYLKVLYDYPRQTLPILVLISNERQTGKSTFINYLSILFGANSVVVNPQDIGNSFNGAYAEKNVIMIEESHFDSRQTLEKIKNLATQKEILVNNKHVTQYSVPFFGKLIITSNDENKFSKIDEEEIRYWVRKIPTLQGKANHGILDDLKDEIPAFLCYLNTLPEVDTLKDRMVFTADEIRTEALVSVKKESREALHKEILIYLDNHAMQNPSVEEFYFIGINIKEKWFNKTSQYGVAYINKVLKTSLKLPKSEKTLRFVPLESQGSFDDKMVGRPYIFKNEYFGLEEDFEPDVPF